MKRFLIAVSLAGVLACGFARNASQSWGQEAVSRLTAPQLFPQGTLAYLRIDDVKQLKADLARSSLGKLGNDSQLKPILQEFYGSLVRNTEQMQEAIGLNLDELLAIPSGEMAVALLPIEREADQERAAGGRSASNEERDDEDTGNQRSGNRRDNAPVVALLLDAGQEISSIQVVLRRIEESIDADKLVYEQKSLDRLTLHRYSNPNRRSSQFAYFIDDGVIVASSDTATTEQLAEKWLGMELEEAKSLADDRRFTSIMSRCVGTEGERPQVSFYADPWAMVRQLAPKNASTSMTLAMLPALGFDGIEAVGGSWIVSPPDFDSISHFHLLLSTPRRSVLGLLRPKSGSTSPELWVPDTAAGYSTINWDIASTVQGVERLYDQFRGPDAFANEVVQRVSDMLEIDFGSDVIDNLEGRITMLSGFVRPVTINSGSNVYAVRLKDSALFKTRVLPNVLAQVEKRSSVVSETFGKLQVSVIEVGRGRAPEGAPIRRPEICVAVIDDYVVVSDSRYMMRQVSDCLSGGGSPLRDALEYQLIADRVTAQLQEKECSGITYSRPEESLQLFYELARDPKNQERLRGMSDNNGFFKALLTALEKHELPPFSVVAQYLAPAGGFLVEEETGLHYTSFSLKRD